MGLQAVTGCDSQLPNHEWDLPASNHSSAIEIQLAGDPVCGAAEKGEYREVDV